ncbi:arginine--tRNA ligase domain-containing protein [Streptomyces asiaticus]
MHVGHLRSAVIGDALRHILDFARRRSAATTSATGGSQFGMLIQYLVEHPDELAPHADVDGEQEAMSARS